MTFTPIETLLGGVLLHLSTSTLLTDTGRVLGISGVVDGALLGDGESWRWATIVGLLSGPVVSHVFRLRGSFPDSGSGSWAVMGMGRLMLAGVLVGFGSRLGSGCTSGHMLCGVSRLSPRSWMATATFFITALITANLFPSPSDTSSPAYALPVRPFAGVPTLGPVLATLLPAHLSLRRYLSTKRETRLKQVPYLLSGLTFSLGLLMSGMVSPLKVISFLRCLPPFTAFDPSLAMIILGGVLPNGIHYAYLKRSNVCPTTTFPWEKWCVPSTTEIDRRLVLGSTVFGVGWGLCGVCPGPALVSLSETMLGAVSGSGGLLGVLSFLCSMAIGMGLARLV